MGDDEYSDSEYSYSDGGGYDTTVIEESYDSAGYESSSSESSDDEPSSYESSDESSSSESSADESSSYESSDESSSYESSADESSSYESSADESSSYESSDGSSSYDQSSGDDAAPAAESFSDSGESDDSTATPVDTSTDDDTSDYQAMSIDTSGDDTAADHVCAAAGCCGGDAPVPADLVTELGGIVVDPQPVDVPESVAVPAPIGHLSPDQVVEPPQELVTLGGNTAGYLPPQPAPTTVAVPPGAQVVAVDAAGNPTHVRYDQPIQPQQDLVTMGGHHDPLAVGPAPGQPLPAAFLPPAAAAPQPLPVAFLPPAAPAPVAAAPLPPGATVAGYDHAGNPMIRYERPIPTIVDPAAPRPAPAGVNPAGAGLSPALLDSYTKTLSLVGYNTTHLGSGVTMGYDSAGRATYSTSTGTFRNEPDAIDDLDRYGRRP